jgi:hypothetical protein
VFLVLGALDLEFRFLVIVGPSLLSLPDAALSCSIDRVYPCQM